MNIEKTFTDFDYHIADNKLVYEKQDYQPATTWSKPLVDGSYAYQNADSKIDPLYFGARYFEKTKDEQLFLDNDFMADLTVLNPGKVGKEFVKTVGHYHTYVEGTKIAYPEAYQAVSGGIEYLLQSEPDKDNKVSALWVIAEPGDIVVMPPNYGHVSMNVGSEPAVEVDLQKRDNPNFSDYSVFKNNVGGALYRTGEGLTKNPNYKIESLRIVKPLAKPEWGIVMGKPLYTSFVENPEKFKWLLEPQKYEFNLDELFEDVEL